MPKPIKSIFAFAPFEHRWVGKDGIAKELSHGKDDEITIPSDWTRDEEAERKNRARNSIPLRGMVFTMPNGNRVVLPLEEV